MDVIAHGFRRSPVVLEGVPDNRRLLWRFWRVQDASLYPPFTNVSVEMPWERGWNTAACSFTSAERERINRGGGQARSAHASGEPAPAEWCTCGISGVTTSHALTDLLEWRRFAGTGLAVAQILWDGVAYESTTWQDPAGTVYVERARITGPIHVSPAAAPHAEGLSQRLDAAPVVGRSWHSWLSSLAS